MDEGKWSKLVLGQLICDVEKAIVKKVLRRDDCTIHEMELGEKDDLLKTDDDQKQTKKSVGRSEGRA